MCVNFVIIASQRTGSNMLVSALDSHPGIQCHGELFRRKNIQMKGALRVLKKLPNKFQSEDYRDHNFEEYLKSVKAVCDKSDFFGFKLMLNQSEPARRSLINDRNVKKILLHRDNLLAVFASTLIAKSTGQGAVVIGKEVKKAKVDFDENKFEKFLINHTARYEETKRLVQDRPDNEAIVIEYLDICKAQGIEEVISFIGAPPNTEAIEVSTVKRNTNAIVERFTNPKRASQYLESIDRTEWAYEQV